MVGNPDVIYLVDGSSYIHRAYHAMGPLSNSKGFPTGAILGFTNMIVKTLKDKSPSRIAVVFDSSGPNFRHEIFPTYKANRPPMPEDLRQQIPWIREIVSAYGLPSLSEEKYEADDIIATLTGLARLKGWKVVVVSADKDLMQLVGTDVTMWDPQRGVVYDSDLVKTKFGVSPLRLLDFLALTGDNSDNIPGVPGVGPKTAASLIADFNSLDELYEQAERIANRKLRQKILDNRANAFLSRKLAELRLDVPVKQDLECLRLSEPNLERLREIFQEFDFRRLSSELPAERTLDFSGYMTIAEMKVLLDWVRRIKEIGTFAIDLETTSQKPVMADLVGVSLCVGNGHACYIPVGHTSGRQLPRADVLDALRPILEDETIRKVGQNIKYDLIVLKKAGVLLRGIACDTMLASYLLDSSRRGHSLDDLAETFLHHRTIPIKDLIGTGKGQVSFSEVDIPRATEYACEDADVTFQVAGIICPRIRTEGLQELFDDVELPLIPVLADMELAGVKIDTSYLSGLSSEFGLMLEVLEAEIYSLAGVRFNINSPKQLGEVLFDRLGMKPVKKTKTGQSTSLEVLDQLAMQHDLPRKILDYRSIFKLKTTYVDSLPCLVNPETGRIHTSYNQAVAATGRLSSSDPNLQNIPVRTTEGRKIRRAFIPDDGYLFIAADYSQIELRVMAHLSGDRRLKEAFDAREDIHAITAASIFQCSPAHVTNEMRRKAKEINFGIIYGMGPFKLSSQIGVGLKMARNYLEDYYQTYSGVKTFMEELPVRATRDGFVTTILGRKRLLPDLANPNRVAQQAAKRMAVNTTIQGSAADLIKLAMIRTHSAISRHQVPARMILQVHDELIVEVRADAAEEVSQLIREEMEGAYSLKVPLVVDVAIGRNWEEAH